MKLAKPTGCSSHPNTKTETPILDAAEDPLTRRWSTQIPEKVVYACIFRSIFCKCNLWYLWSITIPAPCKRQCAELHRANSRRVHEIGIYAGISSVSPTCALLRKSCFTWYYYVLTPLAPRPQFRTGNNNNVPIHLSGGRS